jgi:Tol biopolymer transport system component
MKSAVVVDGVEGKEYDEIGRFIFSSDSKRVAYAAKRNGKWLIVVDEVESSEYDGIMTGTPIFSPDSKRVAYAVIRRKYSWLGLTTSSVYVTVVDGVEGSEYDEMAGFTFSPDSKRLAYGAKRGGKCMFVVDGVEDSEYDDLLSVPIFSPDSKRG